MLVRLIGYYCNLIKRSSLFLWLLAWLTSIGIIFCEGLTLVNCVILFTFKILLISLLPPAKSFKVFTPLHEEFQRDQIFITTGRFFFNAQSTCQ